MSTASNEVLKATIDGLVKKIMMESPMTPGGAVTVTLTKPECDAILSMAQGGIQYHFHPAKGQRLRAVGSVVVIEDD